MRTILLALVAAAVCVLAACSPCSFSLHNLGCVHECSTTADCDAGMVCVHEHAHDLELDTCEAPCTYSDAGAPSFSCPDSPSGTACKNDDGTPFCPPKF